MRLAWGRRLGARTCACSSHDPAGLVVAQEQLGIVGMRTMKKPSPNLDEAPVAFRMPEGTRVRLGPHQGRCPAARRPRDRTAPHVGADLVELADGDVLVLPPSPGRRKRSSRRRRPAQPLRVSGSIHIDWKSHVGGAGHALRSCPRRWRACSARRPCRPGPRSGIDAQVGVVEAAVHVWGCGSPAEGLAVVVAAEDVPSLVSARTYTTLGELGATLMPSRPMSFGRPFSSSSRCARRRPTSTRRPSRCRSSGSTACARSATARRRGCWGSAGRCRGRPRRAGRRCRGPSPRSRRRSAHEHAALRVRPVRVADRRDVDLRGRSG